MRPIQIYDQITLRRPFALGHVSGSFTFINTFYFLCSLLTSLFVFFAYLGGFSRLNPKNFQWISGDNSLSYIAQLFFLTDNWRFPLGANPNYGLELSTSLTYTSPPLPLMLLQKILRLSPELQFVGLWLLICLALQVFFGAKIAHELGGNLIQSYSFGVLQITPFMLMRMEIHYWLSAHFIILWSLLIVVRYLKTKNVPIYQVVLILALGYTIHGYLLLFSIIIFFVICIREFTQEKVRLTQLSRSLLLSLLMTPLFCSFLIDGFGSSSASFYDKIFMNFTGEYSFYPSNLLAPINPAIGFERDCSIYHCMYGGDVPGYVVENFSISSVDLGGIQGNQEGFLYLGAGLIFFSFFVSLRVLTLKLWKLRFVRFVNEWLFVLIYFGFIYIFSVTNRISLGSTEIHIPIPKWLRWGLSIFRGTGRFNWIIVYVGLAFLFLLGIRYLSRRTLSITLLFALSLQVFDLSAPIMNRFKAIDSADIRSFDLSPKLAETFSELSQDKLYLKVYPSSTMQGFPSLAYFAWKEGLATNQARSARFDYVQSRRSDQALYQQICSDGIPSEILVVIPSSNMELFAPCNVSDRVRAQIEDLTFLSD